MQVTQIGPINAGAAPVHYEIGDQNGVIQLIPAGIAVTLDPSLAGVVVLQDDSGWFFSAPASMPAAAGPVTFTDTSSATGGTPVTGVFPCSVNAEAVTALTLFQQ
jgi:hypothetical protein